MNAKEISPATEEPKKSTSLFWKKNRWWMVLIVALIALALLGRGVKKYNEFQQTLTNYNSSDNTFSTQIPHAWEENKKQLAGALVTSFVDTSVQTMSSTKPYVLVARGAMEGDIDEVFSTSIEKYQKQIMKMKLIDTSSVNVGGESGRKAIFEGFIGGKNLRYEVVFVKHAGIIYTITAASSPEDAPALHKQFVAMLDGWQFGNTLQPQPALVTPQQNTGTITTGSVATGTVTTGSVATGTLGTGK